MQTMLSLKSGDVDSTSERRADTQQKFEKRCIWRSACVFVTRTARRVERCQSSSAHLSHQGGFAAGPLRQHLLGWMVVVQRGPQRPDGWLELGERETQGAGRHPMVVCARVAACAIVLDFMDLIQSDTGNKAELSAIIPHSQKPARKEKGDVCLFP